MRFHVHEKPQYVCDLVMDLDGLLQKVQQPKVSDESLTQWMLATVDIFGRIANNAKTLVFKSFRSLKRSELRAFVESHIMQQRALESLHYGRFSDENVYKPAGMVVTYPEATKMLFDAYKRLNTLVAMQEALSTLNQLNTQFMRNLSGENSGIPTLTDEQVNRLVSELETALSKLSSATSTGQSDVIKAATDLTEEIFGTVEEAEKNSIIVTDKTGNVVDMIPFTKMFRSMEEFKTVKTVLLDMEVYLLEVAQVNAILEKQNVVTRSITRTIQAHEREIPAAVVQGVIQYFKYLATVISYYGYATATQMVLEHNYALSCQYLYKLL